MTPSSLSSHQKKETLQSQPDQEVFADYVEFLTGVYDTMVANYYQPVSQQAFDSFLVTFKEKIYSQLANKGKSLDFIKWRSAAFLVEALRSQEDVFSAFYPPQPAKEYKETALGKRVDLGISGSLEPFGFVVDHVEPRSDAYEKGLRPGYIIVQVDEVSIMDLEKDEIMNLFNPLESSRVVIGFKKDQKEKIEQISVLSEEYFKQTVFLVPVPIPHVYCLKIERFNKKTADDLLRFMNFFKEQGPIKGLILDLRDNPGGPPLAARQMAAFFLEGGTDFAYFQKNNKPKAALDVPAIPERFKYEGPMVILVNENSGSASELFSGILQKRQRAVLMGTNTAGQVMLKSMFPLGDESMILLITARGHHPDGSVFSFDGLTPNRSEEDIGEDTLIEYASKYLVYVNLKNAQGCDDKSGSEGCEHDSNQS